MFEWCVCLWEGQKFTPEETRTGAPHIAVTAAYIYHVKTFCHITIKIFEEMGGQYLNILLVVKNLLALISISLSHQRNHRGCQKF
jgi:hypothetical protein